MTVGFKVEDGESGDTAKVTKYNQLVTAPLDFSTFYTANAATVNTAYNVIVPRTNKIFIITDIVLGANRNVSGTNGAIVDLYEATGPGVTVVSKQIIQDELLKQTKLVLTGLNIAVTEGTWVNLKTDDDDIRANIGGYYVPVFESIL